MFTWDIFILSDLNYRDPILNFSALKSELLYYESNVDPHYADIWIYSSSIFRDVHTLLQGWIQDLNVGGARFISEQQNPDL